MAETLRGDGKAVNVTTNGEYTKGQPAYLQGFHGIVMANAASGETVALEIALREHEINLGGVAGAKGAIIYITSAGALTATEGSNIPFMKITRAKDSNNIAWGVLLPQS